MADLAAVLLHESGPLSGPVTEFLPREGGSVAYVEFPLSSEPRVQVAEMAHVLFRGGELTKHIEVEARVVAHARDEVRHTCGFQLDQETRMTLCPPTNRRRALRVRTQSREPIDVRLCSLDGTELSRSVVQDVSACGVGVFVTREEEQRLAGLWEFLVRLELPGVSGFLEFRSTVRQRRLTGSTILYGIRFDEAGTEKFASKQDHIYTYVMKRQREILESRRGRVA